MLKKDEIEEEDIESLLVQQIEFCSTLVINKKDLVSEDDFKKVRKVIEALHPDAKIFETDHGKVPFEQILNTKSFDFERVYSSAGWCKKLEEDEAEEDHDDEHDSHEEGEHHHHEHRHEGEEEDEYGIGTFIYTRRRPFDRMKLDNYAGSWPRNIIRCKGLVWFSDEDDAAYVFETSGRQIQAGYSGQWIATASKSEQRKILAANPQIQKEWDDQVGDRMIKLCVIGQNLDKQKIADELDACLA